MRPFLLLGTALAAVALAVNPAHASGWSDVLSDDPQARNAMDTVERAYESWRSSGNATRGASGSLMDLLYNSDTLVCGAWIIQFRSWYFGFVLESVRNPSPEALALEQSAGDLLNAVIAACAPILDPETARLVREEGFTDPHRPPPAGNPDTPPPPFEVREVDGVWVVATDDEICVRRCQPLRQAFLDARGEVLRIERAIADAQRRAGVMETDQIPFREAQLAAAEAEVAGIRQTLNQIAARRNGRYSQAYAEAQSRLNQAEPEVGNRRRELEAARSELDGIRREIADLEARLPAALGAMEAALEAYRQCLRACIRMAEAGPDNRGRWARETLIVLDEWERTIRNIRETRAIPRDERHSSSGPAPVTIPNVLMEREPRVVLVSSLGSGALDVGLHPGIGFQRPSGGPETFAGISDEAFQMQTLSMILFPMAWRQWLLSGSLTYGRGDAEAEGRVPDGSGVDAGFVYGGLSPSGSSGVNLGNRGLDWATEAEADLWHLKFKMTRMASGPVAMFIYANYVRAAREYLGQAHGEVHFADSSGPGQTYLLSQERRQQVTDDLFGFGVGAGFHIPLGDTRWRSGGWMSLGPAWRRSSLDSVERNRCDTLCGPANEDFTLAFDEEDDGFTWTAAAGLYLEYALSDGVSLGVGADAGWVDRVGTVVNPHSGDQVFYDGETTRLGSDSALNYNFRVGVRFSF